MLLFSVDKVQKEYRNLALEFEGGDGEKTLGEVEKAFILWRKRYIIIPSLPPPPPQVPHSESSIIFCLVK